MAEANPAEILAAVKAGINRDGANNPKGDLSTRKIVVSGVGEVELVPDRVHATIDVTSVKNSVEEARESVQRRAGYIRQVLRNNGLRDANHEASTTIQRNGTPENTFTVRTEFALTFADPVACERVLNTLTEKLETNVTLSKPKFSQSKRRLDEARNARDKAALVAKTVRDDVGRVVLVEEEYNECSGPEEGELVDRADELVSMRQRMRMATLVFRAKVNATFELKNRKNQRT
ncbi:interleukin-1 receptor-associated kinase 1-binding protein 1-like isoform X2 [Oscarella lobularis]|uniref:interleukin-1 receptor-associated kinase 1-binding protein 1-like isoform X2 n=1 Tax=Oscarella lobularis TaxID=121494 RepID=UPI00331317EC